MFEILIKILKRTIERLRSEAPCVQVDHHQLAKNVDAMYKPDRGIEENASKLFARTVNDYYKEE